MIKIPDASVEAAALDIFRVGFERDPLEGDAFDADRLAFARKYAHAAIVAALNAWQGATWDERYVDPKLLCLPVKASDE